MSKLISVIIPIYNEAINVSLIYNAVIAEFAKFGADFDYELIFIDDGSVDSSLSEIKGIADKDQKVKYIEFSRNFGKEVATTAGINNAKGNAAILIDADMQHPPRLIPEFVAKWQDGFDMVIGVRQQNSREGFIKKIGSMVFYSIMNIISETDMTARGTDYRLIDKKIINEFNRFTEHNRITRGLLDWLGFKKAYISFVADPRVNGVASYKKIKLMKLAVSTFISHSLFPLRLAGYLGVLIILFSGSLGFFIFVNKYIINDPFSFNFSGPAILAVINLFLIGIVLSCLGLISLYIGNIQNESLNRPLYVIRNKKRLDFDDDK